MEETIRYILSFLCRSEELADMVGYTSDKSEWGKYKVIILPSGFFTAGEYLQPSSMPAAPLKKLNGTPILFGSPVIRRDKQTIIEADLIASAYFILCRYEECVNPRRDYLGRFLAEHSILSQYTNRCLVEEYGNILLSELKNCGIETNETAPQLKLIMTHDADKIEQYRNIRGFMGGLSRGQILPALKSAFGRIEYDPLFTFPYMKEQEQKAGIKDMLFVKTGGNRLLQDKPCYDPALRDMQKMMGLYDHIGLHLSMEAGQNMHEAAWEKEKLEKALGRRITDNRNHYLASLHPADMLGLSSIGITDDYTMGYPDRAGFRLGTCRPVRFINPANCKLSDIVMHPLVIMDRSLESKQYMNLDYGQAYGLCKQLHAEACKYGGEFIMLWHNNSVSELDKTYLKKLYENILSEDFLSSKASE